jgi:sugar O-acyltransferase (sialic acid O-acetyltransferase NeuD family)
MKTNIFLIGYSGHAYVVCNIFIKNNRKVIGYFDISEKEKNPFGLKYFGKETSESSIELIKQNDYFVAIGDNLIREKIHLFIAKMASKEPIVAAHPSAIISENAYVENGVMISAGCIINPFAEIRMGTICNTGSIIEHECSVGNFSHIAPGAVLTGNVNVGERSFIGANSIVRQGISIGSDVIIGAGTVVTKDIIEPGIYIGNPAKRIK